jgi:hypothetical protein
VSTKQKDPLQNIDQTVPGFIPDPSTYSEPTPGGRRRARTFSQMIADATRGMDAGMNRTTPQDQEDKQLVGDAYKPDWRGHYEKPDCKPAPRASLQLETIPEDEIKPLSVQERMHMAKAFDPSEPRDEHGEWTSGLSGVPSGGQTKDEKRALWIYSGDGFRAINNQLRGRTSQYADPGETQKLIDTLDGAMARSRLTSQVTLYRGMADYSGKYKTDDLVGQTIKDPTFISTSRSEDEANKFFAETGGGFDHSNSYIMEITAPKGTHAIDLDNTAWGHQRAYGEQEVLLDRNAKVHIDRIDHFGRSIYATVVP